MMFRRTVRSLFLIVCLLTAFLFAVSSVSAEVDDVCVIACIGDSITFGTGSEDPATQSYPARLQELLGNGYDVRNYGKAGCSLTSKGVCYTKRPEYQDALASCADVYIVMLGTNDSYADIWDAAEYEECLNTLLDELQAANPDTVIYLMIPPHVYIDKEVRPHSQENDIIGGELRAVLESVSQERSTGLINLFDYTEDRVDLYCQDLLHPSADGYIELANYIASCISLPDRPFTIACVGDSITHGMDTETSYPGQLQLLTGDRCRVENYGKVGVSLTAVGASYFKMPEYKSALASQADLFLIMLGTNDCYADKWDAEAYEQDLKTLIASFRETGDPMICLMIPPHIFIDKAEKPKGQDDWIIREEIAPIIRRVSEEEAVGLIDLYTFTEGRQDLYTSDLLHPSKEGYTEIASYIYSQIEDML